MIDLISAIIPLLQSLLYVSVILFVIFRFKDEVKAIFAAVHSRISAGSSISFAGVSLGAASETNQITAVEAEVIEHTEQTDEVEKFKNARESEYERTKGYFIYHTLSPTKEVGQKYSVGIYLGRHARKYEKSKDRSLDVRSVRFFMGSFWKNRIFEATETEFGLGFVTSAYGEFLVVCELELNNDERMFLYRFVDFGGLERSIILGKL